MATFALRQGVEMKTIQTMFRHSRLTKSRLQYPSRRRSRECVNTPVRFPRTFGTGRPRRPPILL